MSQVGHSCQESMMGPCVHQPAFGTRQGTRIALTPRAQKPGSKAAPRTTLSHCPSIIPPVGECNGSASPCWSLGTTRCIARKHSVQAVSS